MEEKKFNELIVELRKKQGLTQQQLAKKLNITDKAVSKWERGLSYPDITSISMLAKALGVDSAYLIDSCKREGNKNPYQNKESIKDGNWIGPRGLFKAWGYPKEYKYFRNIKDDHLNSLIYTLTEDFNQK